MEREGHPPVRRKWAMPDAWAGRPEKRRRPAGGCKETRSGAADRELMRALPLPRSAESPDTTTTAA